MAALFGRFSRSSENLLIEAQKIARQLERPVQTDVVLLGILSQQGTPAAELLKNVGLSYTKLLEHITGEYQSYILAGQPMPGEMHNLLEESIKLASRFRFSTVEIEHVLFVIAKDEHFLGNYVLRELGVDPKLIVTRLTEWLFSIAMLSQQSQPVPAEGPELRPERERFDIERFIYDVTEAAQKGELDPVIGREREIEQMTHILLRRRKNNPLLIGEPGVGKTALVDALAQRIIRKAVPRALASKRVLTLDLGLVVAGTMYRGQFEERLKGIVQEIETMGNCIVFIDEIHTLSGTGSAEGGFDAANILKPALARSDITVIGATTHEEYRKHILKDKALDRRFQTIVIEEPTPKDAIQMVKGLKKKLEDHHHVFITEEAIKASVELSQRYIHDRFLPDKAIDVLDEAATLHAEAYEEDLQLQHLQQEIAYVATQKAEIVERAITQEDWDLAKALSDKETGLLQDLQHLQQERVRTQVAKPVTAFHVSSVISSRTGVPLSDIEQTLEPIKGEQIKQTLSTHILGQEEAINTISRALLRAQLGLNPPKKPMGSFLLVGPTGVGKTETARILAKEIFGDPKALIKIDMSEFMERHTVSNLIGAPAGYVGFDQGGNLTEQVRRRPYAVILFDEVEKAHPDVFHLLLQILEDGYLTDNTGTSISFEHTFIIMTSNIGMESFNQMARIGFSIEEDEASREVAARDELQRHIGHEIQDFFRPELLGRLSGIIYYQALGKTVVKRLFQRHMQDLRKKLKEKNILLKINPTVYTWLVGRYEPEAGARSIDRIFLQEVEPVILDAMVRNPGKSSFNLETHKENLRVVADSETTPSLTVAA